VQSSTWLLSADVSMCSADSIPNRVEFQAESQVQMEITDDLDVVYLRK
jgi:hypothetical protein